MGFEEVCVRVIVEEVGAGRRRRRMGRRRWHFPAAQGSALVVKQLIDKSIIIKQIICQNGEKRKEKGTYPASQLGGNAHP